MHVSKGCPFAERLLRESKMRIIAALLFACVVAMTAPSFIAADASNKGSKVKPGEKYGYTSGTSGVKCDQNACRAGKTRACVRHINDPIRHLKCCANECTN